MRVRLLHPVHDPDLSPRLPWRLQDLVDEDLELRRVYNAMAAGDEFLLETAKRSCRWRLSTPKSSCTVSKSSQTVSPTMLRCSRFMMLRSTASKSGARCSLAD